MTITTPAAKVREMVFRLAKAQDTFEVVMIRAAYFGSFDCAAYGRDFSTPSLPDDRLLH